MADLFVYGTLMAEEVVTLLLQRMPAHTPATVAGYKRWALKGQVFPAVAPANPSDQLQGMVLKSLNETEMAVLDEYEDEDYYKTTTTAVLQDGSELKDVSIYVWKEDKRHLLHGEWDYEAFRRDHLQDYCNMCQWYAAEISKHWDLKQGVNSM